MEIVAGEWDMVERFRCLIPCNLLINYLTKMVTV
jgi:hypothetical protein